MLTLGTTLPTRFANGGSTGILIPWAKAMFGGTGPIVKRTDAHRFIVRPKRGIVLRSCAWLNGSRRLSKDHEQRPAASEAMIKIAAIHLLVKRLA